MFAEWEKQKGIVLIYPHIFCDFSNNLESTQACYDKIIYEILQHEDIILILHPEDPQSKSRVKNLLSNIKGKGRCNIVEIKSNDLWARDSIAISIKDKESSHMANFTFNAWGIKFDYMLDNAINAELKAMGIFSNMLDYDFILEGGSIDYNGESLLLTNTQCLLNTNRNANLSKQDIEKRLQDYLKVGEILWLSKGFLLGDDTDSHIDTLARFLSNDSIAYVKCYDKTDIHYNELESMEQELKLLSKKYNLSLVPIPFCKYELDSTPLPASYINYLFLNDKTLLVPIYNKPTDKEALECYKKALPHYHIKGINCEALIKEHGSLHCISMQVH